MKLRGFIEVTEAASGDPVQIAVDKILVFGAKIHVGDPLQDPHQTVVHWTAGHGSIEIDQSYDEVCKLIHEAQRPSTRLEYLRS